MATDAGKMIKLVQERCAYGVPNKASGVCSMQDEHGTEMMKLGFDTHRDYITEIGYEAAPEIRIDLCAALAAICTLALHKPVMTAYTLNENDLAGELSDDGTVDEENKMALSLAVAMLKEAVNVYSNTYVEKKAQGEEWHGNS